MDMRLRVGTCRRSQARRFTNQTETSFWLVLPPDPAKPGYNANNSYSQDAESFAVTQLLPNGDLDTSFGNGGTVITSFGDTGSDFANDVVVQPDGKIVVVGDVNVPPETEPGSLYLQQGVYTLSQGSLGMVRYNADGSIDTSFGMDGKVVTAFGGSSSEASGVALQTDGEIVVVGGTQLSSGQEYLDGRSGELQTLTSSTAFPGEQFFTVARFNTDGSLDGTFAQNGVFTD